MKHCMFEGTDCCDHCEPMNDKWEPKTNCDEKHDCTLGKPGNCDYYIVRDGVSVSHVVYCTYFGVKNVPAAAYNHVGYCLERKAWPENQGGKK